MKLIHKKTGETVQRGDAVTLRGGRAVIKGWCMPHKPGSTGRIYVTYNGIEQEFFPNVGGCEWVDREDRVGVKKTKVIDRRS